MKTILNQITEIVSDAFLACGYDEKLGKVTLSNRPDLCDYQCNGSLAGAKMYKKAPLIIANEIVETLKNHAAFCEVTAIAPGFINIKIANAFLVDFLQEMAQSETLGCEKEKPNMVIIDFGGANVAKPLHVGHLRSAIIGESLKRINRFFGVQVIGDVHLGDWGKPMGLVMEELRNRKPELVYFDENYDGDYPKEAPFTITELEDIYPSASLRAKEDEEFAQRAKLATVKMQQRQRGYIALWKHILAVSVADLKKNYDRLHVSFDVWKGESDADPYILPMIEQLKKQGFAYVSDGALVVDVKEESDTREIPPCMIVKSDGGFAYPTTDLATIIEREMLYKPDKTMYVVDKRQELHFIQVIKTAIKTKIASENHTFQFVGFGTMNGKDGKPFKTRDGGVLRLEKLLENVYDAVYEKILENRDEKIEKAEEIAEKIAIAAIKYGDLSNQATKDYIFDIDRFISFDGNTGPYILYAIVRINSILQKYALNNEEVDTKIIEPKTTSEKELMLALTKFNAIMKDAFDENAPHIICNFIFELANAFNHFYHETNILSEEDSNRQAGLIKLLKLTKRTLETGIDLLGFEAPERM